MNPDLIKITDKQGDTGKRSWKNPGSAALYLKLKLQR